MGAANLEHYQIFQSQVLQVDTLLATVVLGIRYQPRFSHQVLSSRQSCCPLLVNRISR